MSKYDDIINLEHYEIKYHPRMSMDKRAGQFAPFAALTGYDSQVTEAGRLTSEKVILTEDEKNILDRKLNMALSLKNNLVNIKYFEKDQLKSGGNYKTIKTKIKKINSNSKEIVLLDNTKIKTEDIVDINFDIDEKE